MFDMIHGVPGCGKRELNTWMQEAMENVLGWAQGIPFVCPVFQNAMAAHINDYTVHRWTGLPVGEADGCSFTRDNHKFSTKCQCLRIIIID